MLNVDLIRKDFPGLEREFYGKRMVYLDNTATSQTPRQVVETVEEIYFQRKANVHRGVSTISQEATMLQETARERIREWINAESIEEIIFTRGTTEGINLVASSFGQRFREGDEVILSEMEHHANIVPWQLLRDRTGIVIKVIPLSADKSTLDIERFRELFSDRTVMVSVTHVSNVLGTVNPVKEIIMEAHARNVPVLIDGAQAMPHMRVDVRDIDADFYVFSSHKMYGPCGVGVLYGKRKWLEEMPPYQGGGEMISHVSFSHTTWAALPYKFEAGTPDFVGIPAFAKAIDYIAEKGIGVIAEHEESLLKYATSRLLEFPEVKIYGNAHHKSAVISFLIGDAHPYDTGMLLDRLGIVVRTGHHCAQPLMETLGIPGTVRVSFALYNTHEEVDKFIAAVKKVIPMLT